MTTAVASPEQALHHLRTPEEYARLRHPTPYAYTAGSDEQLCYLGVHHTTDPYDPILSRIDGAISRYRPDIVFVEGLQDINGPAGIERMVSALSRADAVARGGEAIYTVREAVRRKLAWASPEPEAHEVAAELIHSYYSRDEILAWYVLSLLPQYYARHEATNLAGYIAPFLAQFRQATGWKGFDYSYERAVAVAEAVLRHRLYENVEHIAELTDPIPWPHRWEAQTLFNEMSRVVLRARDRSISAAILNELTAGKRVFVVYGAGHAVMQEPVYRYYFKQ